MALFPPATKQGTHSFRLILTGPDWLSFGALDDLKAQHLHITKKPLPDPKEMPRRLAFQPSARAFGLLSLRTNPLGDTSSSSEDTSYFRVLDAHSLDFLDSFVFPSNETPLCILSTTFSLDAQSYFIVGTCLQMDASSVLPDMDSERMAIDTSAYHATRSSGRLCVFQLSSDRKLFLVSSSQVKSAVYSLASYSGKVLVGTESQVREGID
ncbi:MAG: hypothetical protein ACREHV_05220 [Rhizomicrobium sp.]